MIAQLRGRLACIDAVVWYRWFVRVVLIALQVGLAWGMFGRLGVLTAEAGTVLFPHAVWIPFVRLVGVVLITAPTVEAHLDR